MWFKKAIFLMMLAIMVLAIVVSAFANELDDAAELKRKYFESIVENNPELVSMPPLPASSGDVTDEFRANYDNLVKGLQVIDMRKLRKFKVLLIPGFLTDIGGQSIRVFDWPPLPEEFFYKQTLWLKANRIDYARVPVKTQSRIEVNAAIIIRAIEASDKPVILVGHSKGGLDILEALLVDPDLLDSKVRGVISLQTPFYGSPVADYVLSDTVLDGILTSVLETYGGSDKSLKNLTIQERAPYMAQHKKAIAGLISRVPYISLATWKDSVDGVWDTRFKVIRDEMAAYGIKNDGLVPLDNALLPGSLQIKLEGGDHTTTIRENDQEPCDRAKLLQALLAIILAR